jgi:hypothetical protein
MVLNGREFGAAAANGLPSFPPNRGDLLPVLVMNWRRLT